MTLSGLELSAIVKLALLVAGSDGDFANEEKVAISVELAKFGVKKESVEGILKAALILEPKDALAVVALMDERQKKYVAAFLAVIIAADGEIQKSEVRVWSLISALAALPEMTIGEGLEFWANN